VPKPPPLPGGAKTRATDEPPRSVVARVALTKIAAPRAAVEKGPARGSTTPKRASKPPAKRMSTRPPATKASKPPVRASSPPKSKRPTATDPDEAKIDGGWDEDS
jgi:hypothetical protein